MNDRTRIISAGITLGILLLGTSCTTVRRPTNTTAATASTQRDPALSPVAEAPRAGGSWGARHTPF